MSLARFASVCITTSTALKKMSEDAKAATADVGQAEQKMSDLAKLMAVAEPLGGTLAFGEEGKGAPTPALALKLVKEYALTIKKLREDLDHDTILMHSRIVEGMNAAEEFFRRFFPQWGNLQTLAQELVEQWDRATENVEENVDRVAQKIAEVQRASGGFRATPIATSSAPPPSAPRPPRGTGSSPTPEDEPEDQSRSRLNSTGLV